MFPLQAKWEDIANVRSRPRNVFDENATGYFYPVSRQPIAIHPKLLEKGEEDIQYLLIQSFYKYSHDISMIETKIVNQGILKVISDQMPIPFDEEQKVNLYTIMIDEAYHAYVSYDSLLQIKEHTGVSPLELPKTIEIQRAVTASKKKLDEKYHNIFELICVCLAENTLTKDIIAMMEEEDTHPYFQKLLKEHLADESRHSGIFFHILKYIWETLETDYKKNIGEVLADFLSLYLDMEVQKEFDKQVLLQLNFTESESNAIIEDTYLGFTLSRNHPMLKNILIILNKANLIDEYTSPRLKQKNWID